MSALREVAVTVGGVRSPVLAGGPAEAEETVVFLHGNPGSGRDWEELAGLAAVDLRVRAPDMPGFGRAGKPPGFDYSVPGYVAHLDGLLDALGVRRVVFVAHDFGGPWALAWAAGHPDRVAGLVLVTTGVLPGYRWHAMARIWRTPVLGELSQALSTRWGFRRAMERMNPRGLPPAFVDQMYDNYDRGTRRAVLRLYRATDDPGGAAHDLGAALRPHGMPVLVVWGARDPFIDVSYAHRQLEAFPQARIEILESSGHWPFADAPAEVAAAVLPFLRGERAAAAASGPPATG